MSDTVSTPPKVEPRHSRSADRDPLAEVEKWLAIIRELSSEQAKRPSRV